MGHGDAGIVSVLLDRDRYVNARVITVPQCPKGSHSIGVSKKGTFANSEARV